MIPSTPNDAAFLMQTDSLGSIVWMKSYAFRDHNVINKILVLPNGYYLCTGTTFNGSSPKPDFLTFMTDNSGNVLWSQIYGGSLNDKSNAIVQCDDGGFMMAGTAEDFTKILIIKTDSLGQSGCNESPVNLNVAQPVINEDTLMFITSSSGSAINRIPTFTPNGTGGIVCTSVGFTDLSPENRLDVFPNPTSGSMNIKINDEREFEISIIDHLGKTIYILSKGNNFSVNTDSFPKGIYSVVARCEGTQLVKRMVVL
jgi:hypothetical protein